MDMPATTTPYFQLLNKYRGFIGCREVGFLLWSIVLQKAGRGPSNKTLRALERWGFFQTLAKESSVLPLAVSQHEFRVRFCAPPPSNRVVDMALRAPFSDSSDTHVFSQIFIHKEYLQALEWFSTVCPGGEIATIMDVGANIGCTALFLCTQFSAARIFCVEPEAGNYARLQLNLGLNGHEKIKGVRAAVSTRPGKLQLSRDFRDGKEWGARFIEANPEGDRTEGGQSVEAIEIWALFDQAGFHEVDLLKMDVEGAEADLLRDSQFRLFLKEKVHRVAIEVHEEFMKLGEAMDILKSLGFKTQVVAEFVCGIKAPAGT